METTSSSKKIAIVAIVAVIIVALWFVMKKPTANTAADTQAAVPSETATSQTANVSGAMQADPAVSSVQSSGQSDASLAQDSAAIDAELHGFASDSAAVNSSATVTATKK